MKKTQGEAASISRRAAPVPASQCGLAKSAELLADRMTLMLLREMLYGVTRFDDLRADLDCSRSVLSDRLKRLVELGLVAKHAYREDGQRTRAEYRLTAAAVELGVVFAALMQWGSKHLDEPAAEIHSRRTGSELRAVLVDDKGREVHPLDAVVTLAGGEPLPEA